MSAPPHATSFPVPCRPASHMVCSRVPVNLDHSRSDAGQPKEAYPDICFAVDSCDHAFRSQVRALQGWAVLGWAERGCFPFCLAAAAAAPAPGAAAPACASPAELTSHPAAAPTSTPTQQVLRLPGDCYCVLLHADVASSWRMPAPPPSSSSSGGDAAADAADPAVAAVERGMAALGLSHSEQRPSSGSLPGGLAASSSGSVHSSVHGSPVQAWAQPVVAFSGYVSHQQLTAALGSQLAGDPVRQVLRAAAAAARGKQRGGGAAEPDTLATCRVSMRGPGGRGCADVAVSSFSPASDAGHLPGGPPSTPSGSGGSQGKPLLFARAEQLARGVAAAAKQAAAQAAGDPRAAGVDVEKLALKCALMSLQVPVDLLAECILRAL